MPEILSISYDAEGTLNLSLYDPHEKQVFYITAVGVEVINLLAVDSAFERRVPVGWPGGMKCRPTCSPAHSPIVAQANSGPLSHRSTAG
jgi:hypothetical protein